MWRNALVLLLSGALQFAQAQTGQQDTAKLDQAIDQLVLQLKAHATDSKTVYLSPVVNRDKRYRTAFSDYVTGALRSRLQAAGYQVLDEAAAHEKMADTRALMVRAKQVEKLSQTDAVFTGADTLVQGLYENTPAGLTLSVALQDRAGTQLASAEQVIPVADVPMAYVDDTAEKMADIAAVATEPAQEMVHIATNKGGVAPVYIDGESIQFTLQVKMPLYIAIYSVDSEQHVVRLFPEPGDKDLMQPDQLYLIPGLTDKWRIQVKAPYGLEVVKVIASKERIVPPSMTANAEMLSQDASLASRSLSMSAESIHPLDVVAYYRLQSAKSSANQTYESSVFIRTEQ